MKRFLSISMLTLIACLLYSCKDMDNTYQEFVVPSGLTYPQSAQPAIALAGNQRVLIKWKTPLDPTVTKASIFWNNYTDSIVVPVNHDVDTTYQIIPSLEENSYTLVIKTYDDKGNISVPVEVFGTAYGPIYQSSLFTRPLTSADVNSNGELNLHWGQPDETNGMIKTKVTYRSTDGNNYTINVANNESASLITDYAPRTEFAYTSFFVPEPGCIDTFTVADTGIGLMKIDKSNWTATADSYITWMSASPGNLIDNNPATFWHSQVPDDTWIPVPYPHWFAIDMQADVNIVYIELIRRQGQTGNFSQFVLQGSADGNEWTDIQQYGFDNGTDTPQKFVLPDGSVWRHLRVYAAIGPNMAYMGEISVYGF